MDRKAKSNLMLAALVALLLAASGLAGCTTLEVGAVVEQSTPNPQGTVDEQSGGIEIGIEPTPTAERLTYTNPIYGFEFDYPVTWTLSEADHEVVLKKGTNRLGINFRWADEELDQFGRTGIGAGDLIYAGKVNFMNQVIPAEALFFERRSKAIFYGGTGLIEVGDLAFVIALEDLETDYLEVDLPEEIIAEANSILESFRGPETVTGSENPAEPGGLTAYLKVQSPVQQGSGEPIMVNFLLENQARGAVYLLKWFTPLEGFGGDIFEVTLDGRPLPYQGPVASRGDPTPDSYVFLEPGKGLTAEVNLAEAYDFSQIGTYIIKFRSPRISHLARSEAEMATTSDELGPVNIPSNEVTLKVVASSRLTTEEAAQMISTHLFEQKPDLMEGSPPSFTEIPAQKLWDELQAQLFVVNEGIFQNEAFLIRRERIIQLGTAAGGQGLTSLAVTDLDQDGGPELLFSYNTGVSPSFGSGTQTRVGLYEPASEDSPIIEADLAFLGIAGLRFEDPATITLTVIESNETAKVLRYLETLGQLFLENSETGSSLIFQVNPDLPPELKDKIISSG